MEVCSEKALLDPDPLQSINGESEAQKVHDSGPEARHSDF